MKPEAQQLAGKLRDWNERLTTDDWAIDRQIGDMLWWSALYRSINASRKHLPVDSSEEPLANGPLHALLDEGYTTRQAIAIRRIACDTRKGSNSLTTLLKDIEGSCSKLTRANIFEARQMVYDFEPLQDKQRREARARGERAYSVGYLDSMCLDELWDHVCRIPKDKRSRNDVPQKAWFQEVSNDLAKIVRDVEEYVNNYIAHSALPKRRECMPSNHKELTLDKLWAAERAIVRVGCFLSRIIRGGEAGNVPVCVYDKFEHLDRPFATPEGRAEMERAWQSHEEEIEACRGWTWDRPLTAASERPNAS